MKRGKRDRKFQTNYLPDEFTVTEIKETQVTVENNRTHQIYKRHISFIKLIQKRNYNKERRVDPDVIKTPTRKQYPIRSRKLDKRLGWRDVISFSAVYLVRIISRLFIYI